ncbi:hypothetical protein VFPPC_15390 [Pochonia chlamydosporia 170]|uniref:Uncharacterized protein n=1 Tax=Pochonia chlamydosporia 170 TaxID=1380566 RepID=A0A179G825_METCM|nr:hypothetical protein VFPPC_15390 [Pochonia chlamydosporia 170]OAQ73952.1 hypothetical protein VFPPC_15390 [Pochonia chlamydosporia 170]
MYACRPSKLSCHFIRVRAMHQYPHEKSSTKQQPHRQPHVYCLITHLKYVYYHPGQTLRAGIRTDELRGRTKYLVRLGYCHITLRETLPQPRSDEELAHDRNVISQHVLSTGCLTLPSMYPSIPTHAVRRAKTPHRRHDDPTGTLQNINRHEQLYTYQKRKDLLPPLCHSSPPHPIPTSS